MDNHSFYRVEGRCPVTYVFYFQSFMSIGQISKSVTSFCLLQPCAVTFTLILHFAVSFYLSSFINGAISEDLMHDLIKSVLKNLHYTYCIEN